MVEERGALRLVHQGWEHLRHERPIAAWASWNQALRAEPHNSAAREALERLEGSEPLPRVARGPFRFRGPGDASSRQAWDEVFRATDMQGVAEAAAAFHEIVEHAPGDANARYNAGLCLAWQGENARAIAEFDGLVRLDHVDEAAREAAIEGWMFAEVLRQGAGAEALADEFRCTLEIEWPEDNEGAEEWLGARATILPIAMTGGELSPEVEVLEWLDRRLPESSAVAHGKDLPVVLASVMERGGVMRAVAPAVESIRRVESKLRGWMGDGFVARDRVSSTLPIHLMDLAAWRFRIPDDATAEQHARWTREAIEHYYMSTWADQPRNGLANGAEPLSPRAAAHLPGAEGVSARVRLEAILRVREQLLRRPGSLQLHGGLTLDGVRPLFGLEPHATRRD